MPHPLRFGYKVSAEQFGPSELLDFTVAAEQCGFDTAGISDHFQPWRHSGGHAPFSLAWLGAAGQATTRIQLGTSVLTPTFRYHPARRRASTEHAGLPVPRPCLARCRHRRVIERGSARRRVAGQQGTVRAAHGGGHAHPDPLDAGASEL